MINSYTREVRTGNGPDNFYAALKAMENFKMKMKVKAFENEERMKRDFGLSAPPDRYLHEDTARCAARFYGDPVEIVRVGSDSRRVIPGWYVAPPDDARRIVENVDDAAILK